MNNPRVVVDLEKLRENISFIVQKLKRNKLSIMAVTKSFSAHPEIMSIFEAFDEIDYYGDSRIKNLMSYQKSKKQKVLIRIPMESEVSEVVRYTDISFNSEYRTIAKLDQEARRQNKCHKVVLMVDLGDLREGFFDREELYDCVADIVLLKHIHLYGLAVNLTCYGGVIPNSKNLIQLVEIYKDIEEYFGISLEMISGGNSSSLYLLDDSGDTLPSGINNLRIGESFILGRETAYGKEYDQMNNDVFTLKTEIIELKEKPSYPIGEIGTDAFGKKKNYVDKGKMLRCITAIGQQDVAVDAIVPRDPKIEILGASSDHLLLDLTHTDRNFRLGEEIEFFMSYGSILSTFTSKYINKEFT